MMMSKFDKSGENRHFFYVPYMMTVAMSAIKSTMQEPMK